MRLGHDAAGPLLNASLHCSSNCAYEYSSVCLSRRCIGTLPAHFGVERENGLERTTCIAPEFHATIIPTFLSGFCCWQGNREITRCLFTQEHVMDQDGTKNEAEVTP